MIYLPEISVALHDKVNAADSSNQQRKPNARGEFQFVEHCVAGVVGTVRGVRSPLSGSLGRIYFHRNSLSHFSHHRRYTVV